MRSEQAPSLWCWFSSCSRGRVETRNAPPTPTFNPHTLLSSKANPFASSLGSRRTPDARRGEHDVVDVQRPRRVTLVRLPTELEIVECRGFPCLVRRRRDTPLAGSLHGQAVDRRAVEPETHRVVRAVELPLDAG